MNFDATDSYAGGATSDRLLIPPPPSHTHTHTHTPSPYPHSHISFFWTPGLVFIEPRPVDGNEFGIFREPRWYDMGRGT